MKTSARLDRDFITGRCCACSPSASLDDEVS